jgi:hypothetical protein
VKAQVYRVFPSLEFGEQVIIKEIWFSDSASGLLTETYRLATKFGIVAWGGDNGWVDNLRGARIDGVTHGTVTSTDAKTIVYQPSDFSLHQNYPNPFNSSTIISYSLSVAAPVTLTVHNVLGQKLQTLVSGVQGAGNHQVRFQPEGSPSGVFFLTLRTPNGCMTIRMLLMR